MSASLPSVLARELSEAERVLWEAGAQTIEVRVTSPPRVPRPTGPWRVVRQRSKGRDVQLVVAASVPPPGSEGDRASRQPKSANR